MDFQLRFQKKSILNENQPFLEINESSKYASDFDARGTKLALFFELNPKNAILEHFVISETTSVYSNKEHRQPKFDFHDFSVFFDFWVFVTCVHDNFNAFAAL